APADLAVGPLAHLPPGLRVERQGEVGMRLEVDEAGGDRQPRRVDDPRRRAREPWAERRDPAVRDRHIDDLPGPAAAVDHGAAADQDVPGHRYLLPIEIASLRSQ